MHAQTRLSVRGHAFLLVSKWSHGGYGRLWPIQLWPMLVVSGEWCGQFGPEAARVSHESPRAQTSTFDRSCKTPPKFHEKKPREREEKSENGGGRGIKRAKFWAVRGVRLRWSGAGWSMDPNQQQPQPQQHQHRHGVTQRGHKGRVRTPLPCMGFGMGFGVQV